MVGRSKRYQKCIEEKLSKDPRFKVDDFGESAVKEVIERLKGKLLVFTVFDFSITQSLNHPITRSPFPYPPYHDTP